MRIQLLLLVLVVLFAGTAVYGGSITCGTANTPNPGFTCNLYDTMDNTPNGIFTDTPPPVTLLTPMVPNTEYVIICALPIVLCTTAPSTWADVIDFKTFVDPTNGPTTTAELYTRGCNDVANGLDVSCFPANITSYTPISQTLPVTTFPDGVPGNSDIFNVFIPEPATLPLIGSGLVALGFLARRRKKTA